MPDLRERERERPRLLKRLLPLERVNRLLPPLRLNIMLHLLPDGCFLDQRL